MSNSDGKVVIDTALSTEGIKKDLQTVSKTVEKEMQTATKSIDNINKSVNKVKFDNIGKQLDSVSKAIDNTNNKIELQKKKLVELKKSFEGATDSKSKNKMQEQILNTEASIIKLESRITSLNAKEMKLKIDKNALNGLDGEFKSASVSAVKELDNIEKKSEKTGNAIRKNMGSLSIGEGLVKVGGNITSVGDKLTTRVTLPLLGVGAAAMKVGLDFDSAMSRVKAISGATGEDFNKLKNQAIQLGSDTAFSAKEAAAGMEGLASSGFSVTEIMTAMPGMLDLAASSGEDLATSSDIAASTLRGFGLAADQAGHVADVLAKNAGATNAAVRDTGEAMKYIAPVAQEAGWSLESVTAAIGEMANSGIKGSSSGTTLRSMFSSLVKPSKEAAEAMESMGFKAYGADGKMKSLSTLITDLDKSTAKMTTQQKENTIATLFGQEAMSGILTLIKSGPSGLDDLTNSYKNSDGAAKDMAKTMQDNAKSSIEQMVGSMETAAIKVENIFAPSIKELANYIGNLADKFAELSPEQQEFYAKLAIGAAALGPVTKLVGGLTGGIGGLINIGGKIAPLFGGMAAAETAIGVGATEATIATGGLTTTLGGAALAAAPFILAAAAIGTTGYVIYDSMTKEVIPSVDLFADKIEYTSETVQTQYGDMQKLVVSENTKISKSTKDAVQSYLDMDNDVKKYLQDLYINNSTITEQIVSDSKTKFDSMSKTTIDGYEKQKNEGVSKLQELFGKEKILTTEQQTEILKKTNDYYTDKETKTAEKEAKINEIIKTAKDTTGKLTSEQLQEISSLQNDMRDNAINALSTQESEAAVILQRIKDYDGRITAEQASEKIKALNDSRDKVIQTANDEYDQKIAVISDMRDNVGSITTDEADKMIEEAKRQRDETVDAAQDTRDGAVDKITSMNTEISSSVDTTTGSIITNWDRLKSWWDSWFPAPKTVEVKTEEQVVAKAFSGSAFNNDFVNSNKYLQIGQKNYTGTNTIKTGLSTVDEHGYETSKGNNVKMLSNGLAFLIGQHYTGGDGINSHMTTVNEMQNDITNKVNDSFGKIVSTFVNALGGQSSLLNAIATNTFNAVSTGEKGNQLNAKLATNLIDKMNESSGTFSGIQSGLDNATYAKDNANNMSIDNNQAYIDAKTEVDRISDMTSEAKKALGDAEYKIKKDNADKILDLAKKTAELDITIAKQDADQQVKVANDKKDRLIKLAEATTTAIKAQLEEEKAAAEKVINDKMALQEKAYNSEIARIDKTTAAKTKSIDEEIAALEEQTTNTSRADERKVAKDNINMLTTKMNNTKSQADKDSIALQIKDANKELNNKENTWNIEDEKAKLEEKKALLAEEAQAKKDNLKADYEDHKAIEEAKLKSTDEYYNKLLETDSLNSQARYMMLTESSDQLVTLLNSYAPGWQNAGQSLADSLLTGLNTSKQNVQDAVSEMISLRGTTNTSLSGYATGTSNNPSSGLYKVDEKGFETTTSGSIAYVSKGAAIKNNMQSEAYIDSKIESQVASMKSSILASQADMMNQVIGSITNNTTNKTTHNDNGLMFQIGTLNNYSSKDTEQMMNEAEALRQRNKKA